MKIKYVQQIGRRLRTNKIDPIIISPTHNVNDFPVPTEVDTEFYRNGRQWRVSAVTVKFIIATAVDALLDKYGEPSREQDVIKVVIL